MTLHRETAAPTGIGNGSGNSKGSTPQIYRTTLETSISDYPVFAIAGRFRLPISTAREVCRMAGISGRLK